MADPLSIAASVAGLITLGVQVSMGLTQIISDAQGAHTLLTEVSNDLLILCEILRKIDALTSRWRESTADLVLAGALDGCRGSLKELQSMITTVQETFLRGGLQKRWLQATWSAKKRDIAALSCKITDYKSTLTLTLQMQNALDIGDVKEAIHTFLDSKNEYGERNCRRKETLERYMTSTATSLYSVNRPPSYCPSSMCATPGTSIRSTGESTVFPGSGTTSGSTPVLSLIENGETLSGGRSAQAGSRTGTSSPPKVLLPQTKLESFQIPSSLVGPDVVDTERFWSSLAPELQLTSPAPYNTFQELYLNIYPYLWLHGRVWIGDQMPTGTLLVTRYSPQSGMIEFSRLIAYRANGNFPDDKTVRRETAILRLRNEHFARAHDNGVNTSPYSFHRVSALTPDGQSSSSEQSLWPPMTFPAEDRTSRASARQRGQTGKHSSYSLNLFELRKTDPTRFNRLNRANVELFSCIDPGLYTPDLEHPLRGIWVWDLAVIHRFMLIHQKTRNQMEGIKLTGSKWNPRGVQSFVFDAMQEACQVGQRNNRVLGTVTPCFMTWINTDEINVEYGDDNNLFRRLNVAEFI